MENFTEQNRKVTKQDLDELVEQTQKSAESMMQKSIESMIQKSIDPIVQGATKNLERSEESVSQADKRLVIMNMMVSLARAMAVLVIGLVVFAIAKESGLIQLPIQ